MTAREELRQLHGRAFIDGAVRDDVLIVVSGNSISQVLQSSKPPAAAERVAGVLVPGFIDVHVHGGDGADFMDADRSATERVLRFHATHGTTALLATTLSASPGNLRSAVQTVIDVRSKMPSGAEVAGIHLEGPFVNRDRAGAQDRASIRGADITELHALVDQAPELRWLVTVAPEAEGVLALIEHFRDQVVFSIGHTAASHAEAVAALASGASHFTHLYNAMSGLHHRDPGVVGAAFTSLDATAELIADGIHVHPVALRIAATILSGRTVLVTDAMRACGMPEGNYRLYDYDVTMTDGAARLGDGTLAGSVLTMDAAVRNMIELAGLPFEAVIPMATSVPARLAGVAGRKGVLAEGYDADLVLLDERAQVQRVWARGVEVSGF
ncbi:MAG TPA: N-acetylglucosamine-6-phosphate deacetylase [Thermoanaerobaculia bacterium]